VTFGRQLCRPDLSATGARWRKAALLEGRSTVPGVLFTAVATGPERTTTDNASMAVICADRHLTR
jgi:hypothetical protein